ncbi:DUF1707 domain-containing protein [Streptomyces sp. NPDC051636]|uniref:DUF1707 domain-containing protein n=1 Tax=Streptomyces sp. NPDC051636 TaxID=3365663 RepID=UPI0037A7FE45
MSVEALAERVEAALAARTMGELAGLTSDLPGVAAPVPVKDVVRIEQQAAPPLAAPAGWFHGGWRSTRPWGDVTRDFTRSS